MPIPLPSQAKPVYLGKFMQIYEWPVTMYDATKQIIECLVRPDTAAILGWINDSEIILTKQHQPHRPEPFFDLPGGRVDKDETFLEAAQREFLEETGYTAKHWMHWHTTSHSGSSRFEEAFFLTKDLDSPKALHEDVGEKIELLIYSWQDLVRLCLRSELRRTEIALQILRIEYDPEMRRKLRAFLES